LPKLEVSKKSLLIGGCHVEGDWLYGVSYLLLVSAIFPTAPPILDKNGPHTGACEATPLIGRGQLISWINNMSLII
jgi:hypothetical protein